ncbi:NUDIX hydrolase [Temperatibacter marinus]|uniref:NUDIX hydrolase n=1 Tax=Temperatibacter marinus TaxID=1456591 RepID=A0AA52EE65_9PROT|nr:NUDIX hydrolase [Temperatibacter marinus]WND03075.1 NUDIX hydrolase [Temperatibacter marinus]
MTIIQPQLNDTFSKKVPKGDDHERLVCDTCDFIHYENPKLIVGCVATYQDKILLCKRAIQPQKGLWTLPAGFMELGENPEEGAAREAWEEAQAKVTIKDLLAVYTVKRISQVHLFYRAELSEPVFSAGIESMDVQLFRWTEIPWKFLAFPSVTWALKDYEKVMGSKHFAPFSNPEPYKDI